MEYVNDIEEVERDVLTSLYGTGNVDMQEFAMVISAIRKTYEIMTKGKIES